MEGTVADWLVLAVNTAVSAAMIVFVVSWLSISNNLTSTISEQEAQTLKLQEYKEYNQFDHTHVYAQDAMAAIFKYRGEPSVKVRSSCGTFVWSTTSKPCGYSTTAIAALIDQDVIYDADIDYGANGEVIAVTFTSCDGTCGR